MAITFCQHCMSDFSNHKKSFVWWRHYNARGIINQRIQDKFIGGDKNIQEINGLSPPSHTRILVIWSFVCVRMSLFHLISLSYWYRVRIMGFHHYILIITSKIFVVQLLDDAIAKYRKRKMRMAECALNISVFGIFSIVQNWRVDLRSYLSWISDHPGSLSCTGSSSNH